MTRLLYELVEHDGGWAYKVNGAYSETFRSHGAAEAAARRAAQEQRVSGDDAMIVFQGADGAWREEFEHGSDRPDTEVQG